jgi:hypothetical protein
VSVPNTNTAGFIEVKLTNLQESQVVVAQHSAAELDLQIQIVDESGIIPELTEQAKSPFAGVSGSGSAVRTILEKDEAIRQSIDLLYFYILKPGAYTVSIARKATIAGKEVEVQGKAIIRIPK